jgi:pilus assembly protein FimV
MALLVVCFGISSQGWALGLGEIEVDSALNERLQGSIELLDVASFQSSEVVVSMASREDFRRVGVERFFYLTDIKFTVDLSDNPKVVVTSNQPISEPYLNFIVEVLWPQGKLLKEFTVLLDPPTFSEQVAPVVSAPTQPVAPSRPVAVAPRPQPETPSQTSGTQVDLRPAPAAAPVRRPPSDGVVTTRDDTLWKIASRTLPSAEVSVNQQMLAIQRKNPRAFIRNNINLIKAGYTLDIPSEQEALRITRADANLDVASQTRDWRSGATTQPAATPEVISEAVAGSAPQLASQIDATEAEAAAGETAPQTQGQVRIVASTGELASGTATGTDESVNQLIEEKDTLTRQVDELTYQLDREKDIAANQVTVKDRQLEVKDAEIAHLQEQMKEMREQLAAAAENQNQSPKPDPVEVPWWMSPVVLFGVIGLLVLLLAAALVGLRRGRGDQTEHYETDYASEFEEEADAVSASVSDYENEDEDQGEVDVAVEDEHVESDFEPESERPVEPFIAATDAEDAGADEELPEELEPSESQPPQSGAQSGDVIGEAEIYIAYGRYGQAASLLGGVLNSEPDRWDVRLKLLEVFAESHDEDNFASHAQYIVDNCNDEDVLMACRDLEAQLATSEVGEAAQSVAVESDDPGAIADAGADTDELVLDVDDDFESAGSDLADAAEASDAADESGLDFELEFDTELEAEDGDKVEEDLDGDLGLDFDADDDVESDLARLAGEQEQDDANDSPQDGSDDEFDLDAGDDSDVNATKLDLAEAYVDMGDADGASDILREVLDEGTAEQKQKAQEILDRLAS